jgi:hypothetical protein
MSPRLSRREASAYLEEKHGIKRSPGTLAKYATIGGGPVYQKAGARQVVYPTSGLDAYAENLLSALMRTTSDKSKAA